MSIGWREGEKEVVLIFLQKVNTQLKRSDNELSKLNSVMEQVATDSQMFALNINVEVFPSPKKSRSPGPLLQKLRQQQGKVSRLPSFLRNTSHNSDAGIEEQESEAKPEGVKRSWLAIVQYSQRASCFCMYMTVVCLYILCAMPHLWNIGRIVWIILWFT